MNQEERWLLEEKYGGEKSAGFFTDVERLAFGEPLGYVIGHVPFLDCTIYLDSHPLIPRAETEYWTEKAITEIKNYVGIYVDTYVDVLDLCAGSGAVGVAVAKALPEGRVDFSEIDPHHLPTVKKNLSMNQKVSERKPNVFTSDLFAGLPPEKQYDFILSNPPYIDPALDRTEKAVKDFEPHLALYGGNDGMTIIKKIITDAPKYLKPKGQLWLEHEPEQSQLIKEFATKNNFAVTTHKDQYDLERYSVLVLQ